VRVSQGVADDSLDDDQCPTPKTRPGPWATPQSCFRRPWWKMCTGRLPAGPPRGTSTTTATSPPKTRAVISNLAPLWPALCVSFLCFYCFVLFDDESSTLTLRGERRGLVVS
jgi:hypothetical protein